jgi:hypothetical protein
MNEFTTRDRMTEKGTKKYKNISMLYNTQKATQVF